MIDVKIPRENANDDFVVVTKIHIEDGDKVEVGDVLFEFETSKAAVEIEASTSGFITGFTLREGMQVPVDTVVALISDTDVGNQKHDPSENIETGEADFDDTVFVSNAARVLIDKGKKPVKSGRWVTSKDFDKNQTVTKQIESDLSFDANRFADEKKISVPHRILTIDERKKLEIASIGTTSHYYNSTLGVSFELLKRRVANDFFQNSILDLVLYEASLLLKTSFPDLNACFIGNNQIARYDKVVAGFAIDNLNNLTVVSLDDSNDLSKLSYQIIDVIVRFQDKKLKASDLKSTTFTVTDLSSSNVDFMLPLINGAQSFILGITKTDSKYHVYGTFDHRVTEGKRFAEFLVELKSRILLYSVPLTMDKHNKRCSFCLKSLTEEKSLGSRGFLKIDDGSEEKLICRNCFEGW